MTFRISPEELKEAYEDSQQDYPTVSSSPDVFLQADSVSALIEITARIAKTLLEKEVGRTSLQYMMADRMSNLTDGAKFVPLGSGYLLYLPQLEVTE